MPNEVCKVIILFKLQINISPVVISLVVSITLFVDRPNVFILYPYCTYDPLLPLPSFPFLLSTFNVSIHMV